MRVGILGSGDVGKALARGFASRGHDVTIGSRTPEKLSDFVAQQSGNVRAATFDETAKSAELAVFATLFEGTKSAIDLAGAENFAGKVVIDATNPLKFQEGKLPQLSLGFDNSAGEEIQRWLPAAKVVKAFNTIGNAHMIDPQFPGGPPTMFIAGNDHAAKRTVTEIIESFGWKGAVADVGGIEESRQLESLAILWVHYAFTQGTWSHAFKVLRK
jgi:predicted dinucleotide-binding enzyme